LAEKSRDAFRTISEVADWLDVPTHVLRFWESRFSQIKPVKRAGGRRYYRPSDMRVIGGVKVLLHDQGMTIRGVQKLFREEGIKRVSSYAPDLFGDDDEDRDTAPVLNEVALEAAARPAAPARSTRDATPEPEAAPESTDRVSSEPVFHHSRTTSRIVRQDAAPATPAPADARPTIPATPDVPETDPDDNDANHARKPGLAARLRVVDPARLAAHRDDIAAARDRLQALLEQAD
jgi:DNA-binding transcriptional MerR regulator